MAITREELKVGETYFYGIAERTVLGIGNDKVFYGLNEPGFGYLESIWELESFIEHHSVRPKPKKTIELVGFMHLAGAFVEKKNNSDDFKVLSSAAGWKQVSTRTIEIDE